MGLSRSENRVYNQNDELVMRFIGNGLIQVGDPDAPMEEDPAA